jgi:hypothetical protein
MNAVLNAEQPVATQICLRTGDGYPVQARLFRCNGKVRARARLIVAGANRCVIVYRRFFIKSHHEIHRPFNHCHPAASVHGSSHR